MECNYCCSGYSVDPAAGDKYCGFCGARLKALSARLILPDTPCYIDERNAIEIEIKIKNVGVVDAKIDGIEFP